MKKEKIAEIANQIMSDFGEWAGPDGLCWCDEKQKFVDPETTDCPTCKAQDLTDTRQFRYLRLHDDYRSM